VAKLGSVSARESRFSRKILNLRLLGRGCGLKKPLLMENFDFTALGTGFRAKKAAFYGKF